MTTRTVEYEGKLYSVREFCESIGISTPTFKRKIADGMTTKEIAEYAKTLGVEIIFRGVSVPAHAFAEVCYCSSSAIYYRAKAGENGDQIYEWYRNKNSLPPASSVDLESLVNKARKKPEPRHNHALVAFAIGDALGKPFETHQKKSPELIEWIKNPVYLESSYEGLGQEGKLAGRFTDDTQMALCLAEACRLSSESSGFHQMVAGKGSPVAVESLAKSLYIQWFTGWPKGCVVPGVIDGPRGIGGTVKKSMEDFLANKDKIGGVKIREANSYVGNGGLMRCLPIGIFYRNSQKALFEAVKLDTTNTHDSYEAVAASYAYTLIVSHLMNNGTKGCLSGAISLLEESGYDYTVVYEGLKHVRTMLSIHVVDNDLGNANKMCDYVETIGNGGYVVETLCSSIYLGLKCMDPKTAITASVLAGGDADTRTALTAAIMGLRFDLNIFPADWVSGLECADVIADANKWLLEQPYKEGEEE